MKAKQRTGPSEGIRSSMGRPDMSVNIGWEKRCESRIYHVYNLYKDGLMGIVPVRLDDEDLKRIDLLVKREAYRSRSEAIRQMIKAKLAEAMAEDEDVTDLVASLLRMRRRGRQPVTLRLRKSAVELVAQGRDRWPT